MKIGIIKERKNPPDKRVPFTPEQCKIAKEKFGFDIVVEPSDIRCFKDEDYTKQGIELSTDLSSCDVLMGVKEVPKETLINNKPYFFFSHTIKKQPYNKELMKTLIAKKIQMLDYECLTHENGERIIGFGRYAGIVGTYNGLLAFGKRNQSYTLSPAHSFKNYDELLGELKKVKLPNFKLVITGNGRVGKGAEEILLDLGIQKVTPSSFLNNTFNTPVFCVLELKDMYEFSSEEKFDQKHFYANSEVYKSKFTPYLSAANIFVSAHFWDNKSAPLFTLNQVKASDFSIEVIADITCDIKGSVPTTTRASTIADPIYGIDKQTGEETSYNAPDCITVMAVDNLPCELPANASEDFGNALISFILPEFKDFKNSELLNRSSICIDGKLTPKYEYLNDYAFGE